MTLAKYIMLEFFLYVLLITHYVSRISRAILLIFQKRLERYEVTYEGRYIYDAAASTGKGSDADV